MKKIVVLMSLFFLSITIVSAQQRERPSAEDRAKNQTERVDKVVKLTDEQKTKMQAVNLELAKKADEQMKDRGDRDAMRAKMQEIDSERDQKYKEILTEDQFKKYTEDKAERQKQSEERRKQRGGR